jgi:hypothetical protein
VSVHKFVAGGNHSWFQIDEFMPFKSNYTFPAPIGPAPAKVEKKKSEEKRPQLKNSRS